MSTPEPIAAHLDHLRHEIRRASPLVEGTFRRNRHALIARAMEPLEPRPQDLDAESVLTRAMDAFQIALDGAGLGASVEGERVTALSAVDRFERAIEGCRPNEVTAAIGLGW